MTSLQGLVPSAAFKAFRSIASNDSKLGISLADVEKRIAKGDAANKATPFADFLKSNFSKLDANHNNTISVGELASAASSFKPPSGFSSLAASSALSLITGALA